MQVPPIVTRPNLARFPLIVVEGGSGVGKSTVAKALAEHLGGTYLHGPPDEMSALRSLLDAPSDPLRPLFFAMGNALSSRTAEIHLSRGPVILDRYIYTTVAWHLALGYDVSLPWAALDLLRPDTGFLLVANETTRRGRLQTRSGAPTGSDLQSEQNPTQWESYLAALSAYGLVTLDTSLEAPQAVVRRMLDHRPPTESARQGP